MQRCYSSPGGACSSSANAATMRQFNYQAFLESSLSSEDMIAQASDEQNNVKLEIQVERKKAVTGVNAKQGWFATFGDIEVSIRKTVGEQATKVSELLNVSYQEGPLLQRKVQKDDDVIDLYYQKPKDSTTIDAEDEDNVSECSTTDCSPRSSTFNLSLDNLQELPKNPSFMPVVAAWMVAATKQLMQTAVPLLAKTGPAGLLMAPVSMSCMGGQAGGRVLDSGMIPLKTSGIGEGPVAFIGEELNKVGNAIENHVGLLSLTSAMMFIGSIRGLNNHKTAKQGNYMGMVATAIGLLSILASPGFGGQYARFLTSFLVAGGVGLSVAESVQMEDMPQLVAGFHSFVGLAAVLVGFATHFEPGAAAGMAFLKALETYVGVAIGSLTFTGSVVAAGKLHGVIPGAPVISPYRWTINGGCLLASLVLGYVYCNHAAAAGTFALLTNTALWGALGVNMVMPVGGADMPIVVSLLNSFSGIATAASGFALRNDLLTITGALVASSGALLSDIMCRGINRSLPNVLLGGFGVESGTQPGTGGGSAFKGGTYTEISHQGCAELFLEAKKILIVPGYGMAVARCQQRLAEIVEMLRSHGKTVHFAIHPVAGRLPGHMNVLLAEANVPYDIVKEMEDINHAITTYDVAIVIGANDIVNPATVSDVSSPIYGMPAIEVWKCRKCIVMKRSMATGYSGVENPLFYLANVQMLFGDAKGTVDSLGVFINERKDEIISSAKDDASSEEEEFVNNQKEIVYPEPMQALGIITETTEDNQDEKRVAMTPAVVQKVRQLGYSIVMQSGAGNAAGFPDEAYLDRGGVTIVKSEKHVFEEADIILKVSPPTKAELEKLSPEKTFISIWSMFGNEELLQTLENRKQQSPTVFNMALIPRISRAQALDVLTSMANIAGYRAVLDAFNLFPKFARTSVTASGNTPPAKVFIIGAGVAGLSAIATANALGAKVYATDVRSAAKEQVESMGAEFVMVDESLMIKGEGAGGYAKEMGDQFKVAQTALYTKMCKDADVVISTALIPNRPAPVVITEAMVGQMKRGSVIVDLGAPNGGNCELTQVGTTITTDNVYLEDGTAAPRGGGITIIGKTNYPSEMATQASDFIARNFANFLEVMGGAETKASDLNMEDQVIRDSVICWKDGGIMYPPPPPPTPKEDPNKAQQEQDLKTSSSSANVMVGNSQASATPELVQFIIDWIMENREEVTALLGMGVVLGLGLGTNPLREDVTQLGYFVLSLLIGHFTVASVTPALHTPLISVTNAISGIIVIGGMLQLGGPLMSIRVVCAMLSIFFSSVNIVGGFAVTKRMLEMFKSDRD